ncbi:MAG: ATP-dependent DNA helicase RecG, partial [Gammaproteobacteria bacterium]|nr:ATP-dependent DNA helicase RecG [Gammaproteobacteria bacterium]
STTQHRRFATPVQSFLNAAAYTKDEPVERREQLEQELVANELKVLVATNALGMGFDKPDLAFVVHYQAPGSVVAYYQQVGRAGRALATAYGVLLAGSEDTDVTSYFIDTAFPSRTEVQGVLGALEDAPDGLSVAEIERQLNVKKRRIDSTTLLLSLQSPAPLAKSGRRWQLTAARLSDGFWERAERLTSLRRDEQRQMQEYVNLSSGHMEFLIRALDGDPAGYSRPNLPPLPSQPDPEQVRAAVDFLGRLSLDIEPRRQRPDRRRIDPSQMAEMGKALCDWGDPGWGELVRRGKYRDGCFDQALVTACADLVRRWAPHPEPLWVTAIPSRRRPRLVPDFAKQLAASLDLPYSDSFVRTRNHAEQKTMQNSAWQAQNVTDSMAVQDGAMLTGPVLLVDDIVDSRWTMTVAAQLLREAGSGEVWPPGLG